MAKGSIKRCYSCSLLGHTILECPERRSVLNRQFASRQCKCGAPDSWVTISKSSAGKMVVFLSGVAVAVFIMKAFPVFKGKC